MFTWTMTVKKASAWKFVTFGSGGLSLEFVAAEGGQAILQDPKGVQDAFTYGGIGAGLSLGLKIPKIGKLRIPTKRGALTGGVGPTAFPSTGEVFITSSFSGNELSRSDIQGVCAFVEAGGGLLGGGSGTAMLLNLNARLLPLVLAPVVGSLGTQLFLNSAKGILLMAGLSVGLQAQVGVAAYLGYLR
jgi:hypothetical protein